MYAEDLNYFDTTIDVYQSLGEINSELKRFGASYIAQAEREEAGIPYHDVSFFWKDNFYKFTFTPAECRFPTKTITRSKKPLSHSEMALKQMGRIAYYFVKSILVAAEAQPHALYGFMVLPNINKTVGEILEANGNNLMLGDGK